MKRFMLLLVIPLTVFVFASYGCKEKEQAKEGVGEVKKEAKEEAKPVAKPKPKKAEPATKVNINTATAGELAQVPGIGEKLARRIVRYREKRGDFQTIEDIKKVKANWDKRYNKAKNYITVGGPAAPAPGGGETAPGGAESTPAPQPAQ
ncbi:MAG TPA: helix-hairpin-helix domain-containing protein [Thermodesulfobacteriota bacterium]|nr:helix-hairpin-helix domain-containing protein [Thermodesulfobacteriota bacterium]